MPPSSPAHATAAAPVRTPRQVLVVGASTTTISLATILAANGLQVLVLEDREEKTAHLDPLLAAQLVDDVDVAALVQVGVADFDLVVLDLEERFGRTALLASYTSDAGVSRIWVTARTEAQSRILHRLEVERVLTPELDAATTYAAEALSLQPPWIRLQGEEVLALIPTPRGPRARALLLETLRGQDRMRVLAVASPGADGARPASVDGPLQAHTQLAISGPQHLVVNLYRTALEGTP